MVHLLFNSRRCLSCFHHLFEYDGLVFAKRSISSSGQSKPNLASVTVMIGRLIIQFCYQTIVITGGSQGMGRGVAKLLAAKGANIVIVARTAEKLEVAIKYIAVSEIRVSSLLLSAGMLWTMSHLFLP